MKLRIPSEYFYSLCFCMQILAAPPTIPAADKSHPTVKKVPPSPVLTKKITPMPPKKLSSTTKKPALAKPRAAQATIAPRSVALEDKKDGKTIRLNNLIDKNAITYTKNWHKPFPSTFKLIINDQEYINVQKGKPKFFTEKPLVLAANKKVKVAYEWTLKQLGKLWHTEKKEMEFELPENTQEISMKFSWDDDNRIVLDNAKMLRCIDL